MLLISFTISRSEKKKNVKNRTCLSLVIKEFLNWKGIYPKWENFQLVRHVSIVWEHLMGQNEVYATFKGFEILCLRLFILLFPHSLRKSNFDNIHKIFSATLQITVIETIIYWKKVLYMLPTILISSIIGMIHRDIV